jgi:hypothetical protein
MPTRRFERIALALVLLGGWVFGDCGRIEHAQAQQPSAPAAPPPTPPTQSPTVNPSNPTTVQQPSYRPVSPSTPSTTTSTPSTVPSGQSTAPANEQPASTTTPSEQKTSVAKKRAVHHYRRRPTVLTYSCGHSGCVRTYSWAFPCQYYSRYCSPHAVYAASAHWWPGYYDYAPGQFGRARYLGRGHRAGYWGD